MRRDQRKYWTIKCGRPLEYGTYVYGQMSGMQGRMWRSGSLQTMPCNSRGLWKLIARYLLPLFVSFPYLSAIPMNCPPHDTRIHIWGEQCIEHQDCIGTNTRNDSQERALNTSDLYEVRKIVQRRRNDANEWEYLTQWKFYTDETWETAATFRDNAMSILTAFNEKQSSQTKPVPKRKRQKPLASCEPFNYTTVPHGDILQS